MHIGDLGDRRDELVVADLSIGRRCVGCLFALAGGKSLLGSGRHRSAVTDRRSIASTGGVVRAVVLVQRCSVSGCSKSGGGRGSELVRADGEAAILAALGRRRGRLRGHAIGLVAVRGVQTGLNEIFAFGLLDQWLKLGGSEGVDQASLGDHEKEDLGAGQDRQFVRLLHDTRLALRKGDVATRFVGDVFDADLATTRLSVLVNKGEPSWHVVGCLLAFGVGSGLSF